MKKVIIINNDLKAGGVQKALVNLIHEIHNQYNVTLLLFNNTGELIDKIPDDVRIQTVTSWFRFIGKSQAECTGIDFLIRGFLALVTKLLGRQYAMKLILPTQRMISESFDVAISYLHNGDTHSFYGGCNDFLIRCVTAKKKIAFLHCDYEKCGANVDSNNVLFDLVDTIATCSKGCKDSFLNCLPAFSSKTSVVLNCHNYKEIKEKSMEENIFFPDDQIIVLTVARLTKEKGIDRGIIAVSECSKKGIHIMYYVVGDGVQKKELNALAESLGVGNRVVFCGEVENPYKYMRKADLLLIPSYHEAAPMVIGEAAVLGLPVLSTKTISSLEMIQNRNIGWVVDNNQEAINKKLIDVCQNRLLIQEEKRQLAQRKFSNIQAVRQFNKILDL